MRTVWRTAIVFGLAPPALLLLAVFALRSGSNVDWRDTRPQSTEVLAQGGELLRLTLASDQRYRLWLSDADIPPAFVEALLLKEDRYFHWHAGVNPFSVLRAVWARAGNADSRVGASTLTMQLARLSDRRDTQHVGGKLAQMARALLINARFSKSETLSAYINLAPMGGNVEGLGAASLIYFGKPARQLDLVEILTLAVLPQRPRLQAFDRDLRLTEASHQARLRLFEAWIERHPEDARFRALIERPTRLRAPAGLPFLAAHAVDQVLRERFQAVRADTRLQTTIDWPLQQRLEHEVERYLREQHRLGFDNASALLIDVRDARIKALLGSADYFNPTIAGQINGTTTKRSPGSTLKPFLYALAIDQGLLHPASILRDVPTRFGAFSPENFDGEFVGPISATQALIRSRNIPAVQIASRLGQPNLYALLKAAGVRQLAREQHYGLALVLGGGDISMQELGALYVMLAAEGRYRPLGLLPTGTDQASLALLSAQASFVVQDMLQQNPRPDGQQARLPIAWKTGTSWGFRDAWTAGIVGHYVLVVWLGNFDNRAHPNLIGVQAAAPLFFRIADALSERADISPPPSTLALNLKRVAVCAASGDLPNADCPDTVPTWFIPGKTSIRISQLHRRVWFDRASGKALCAPNHTGAARAEVYEYWPSELAESLRKAGRVRRAGPDLSHCQLGVSTIAARPHIQSPGRSGTYVLDSRSAETIGLLASAESSTQTLYWYADAALIGTSRPEQHLDWRPPRSGQFQLRVSDGSGQTDTRTLHIAFR